MNPQALAGTCPSNMRVCQFHHPGGKSEGKAFYPPGGVAVKGHGAAEDGAV